MTIQLDYGGFDPSFLGVTIRFSNERVWEIYQEFVENPKPPKIDLTNPDLAFEALSITSVISHEVRHFHDFLLTAYSAHIFHLRIQALVNLLQLTPLMTGDSGGNCIPVPLSTWARLGQEKRERLLSSFPIVGGIKAWIPVSIPVVEESTTPSHTDAPVDSAEGVKSLIAAATLSISKVRDLTYNPNTVNGDRSFQAWQVFELSGVLTQIQDIWLTYGQMETELFVRYILSKKGNPYGGMLSVVWHLFDKMSRPFDPNIASVMTLWSLLGSYSVDGWNACPTTRFVRLWEYISREGLAEDQTPPFELFDRWSHALGLSTVTQGLDDSVKTFTRISDLIQKRVLGATDSFVNKKYGAFLFRVTDGVARACQHMVKEFRREPEKYLFPYLYLEHASNFVNPSQRILGEGGFLRFKLPLNALRKKGYIIEWATTRDGAELIASAIVPFSVSKFCFISAEDAHELSTMIALTDFLFADAARATVDIQRAGKTWFSEAKIQPLEILN
jgi:hypothetical protein